jgi:hypothetical protein
VFENGVPRMIIGSMRMEVTREWRKLHKEELHNLYSPNSIKMSNSRRMGWTRHEAQMAEKGNSYKVLTRKPVTNRKRCT